ncbi:MAG: TraB/GumN family protein [Kiritimatiellia bacterium]|nr:TraB/GumN family protein [Kiritimatiellia bacterium]MDP6848841.1 TraB/GumN family protein [Kiritimatiellia bacterium]
MKSMRRRVFLAGLCASALLVQLCSGAPAQDTGKHSLWKVSSGSNAVYLLGSIHLLKEEHYPLPGAMNKAFEDSGSLVLEVNLEDATSVKAQMAMMTRAMLQPPETLKDKLSEETYSIAAREMKALGLDISALGQLKPWMVMLTMAQLKLQKLGFRPDLGLDMHFFGKAKKAGKKIIGLETLEFQINLFDNLTDKQQEELIKQTVEDLGVLESEMKTVLEAWSTGNGEKLSAVLSKSFDKFPELKKSLFTDRNDAWIGKIEPLLKEDKNYLVVVGAGHLVGKEGLVAAFRKKGFKVEQL